MVRPQETDFRITKEYPTGEERGSYQLKVGVGEVFHQTVEEKKTQVLSDISGVELHRPLPHHVMNIAYITGSVFILRILN